MSIQQARTDIGALRELEEFPLVEAPFGQAHHLDLDFYDRFFKPGAYQRTHAEHMRRWHLESPGD